MEFRFGGRDRTRGARSTSDGSREARLDCGGDPYAPCIIGRNLIQLEERRLRSIRFATGQGVLGLRHSAIGAPAADTLLEIGPCFR
jgi:hypothetical protein